MNALRGAEHAQKAMSRVPEPQPINSLLSWVTEEEVKKQQKPCCF